MWLVAPMRKFATEKNSSCQLVLFWNANLSQLLKVIHSAKKNCTFSCAPCSHFPFLLYGKCYWKLWTNHFVYMQTQPKSRHTVYQNLFSTFYFKIYILGIRQYIKVGVCLTWLHENKEGWNKVKRVDHEAHNNTAITGNSIGPYTNNTVKPAD